MAGARLMRAAWSAVRAWRRSDAFVPLAALMGIEALGLLGLLFATRLAALNLGPVGFGEFAIARRSAPVLATAVMLGLGVALPRMVAEHPHDAGARRAHLYAALVIVALSCAVGTLLLPFLPGGGGGPLGLAIAAYAFGLAVHGVAYGYERGRLALWRANLLAAVPFAVPVAVLFVTPGPAAFVVLVIGLATLACTVIMLAQHLGGGPSIGAVRSAGSALLRFGVPRTPGDMALFVLFAIPAWHLGRTVGVTASGLITVPITVIQGGAAGFAGAGAFLLPLVARERTLGRMDRARRWVHYAAIVSLVLGGIGALVALAAFDTFARILVGPELGAQAWPGRYLLLGLPGWLVYIVLRNPIDAVSTSPVNVWYLVAAAAVFWVALLFVPPSLEAVGIVSAIVLNSVGATAWIAWRAVSGAR